jgi:predicted TIM-barrel fold metal-dependent hydrolase
MRELLELINEDESTMRTTVAGDLGSNPDQATILERLNEVLDPELDESIVKLGFVRSIVRRGAHVHVVLELPTSWCAITFAYIMAEDIRRALLGCAGIKQVTIGLLDHCAAQEIEAAVNTGRTFADAFPQEVDIAILNSTYLREFYKNGFNTHAQNALIKNKYPERFLLCGTFDPREEHAGLDAFRQMMSEYPISGLKLYTAEWRGNSRGWRLNDAWAYKYLELAQRMGIKNIHVHKGPTVYPLNIDAFDVRDVDHAATDFPNLNFIVEHVGLPRLDDFCWIAAQESNVYAGLSVAMAFVHSRPRYFGEILANLLFWLGPDKLCFGSDYAIWSPKWLVDKFMAYQMPEDLKQEYHADLTLEIKRKILGENAARLYGINVARQAEKLGRDPIGQELAMQAQGAAIMAKAARA